jgi:hypothetical protein
MLTMMIVKALVIFGVAMGTLEGLRRWRKTTTSGGSEGSDSPEE